jgi:monoamine oxidase
MTIDTVQVAIVGAYMNSLHAAKEVHNAGLSYIVLEGMNYADGKALSTVIKDNEDSLVQEDAA